VVIARTLRPARPAGFVVLWFGGNAAGETFKPTEVEARAEVDRVRALGAPYYVSRLERVEPSAHHNGYDRTELSLDGGQVAA
jgi:hypothetical protein